MSLTSLVDERIVRKEQNLLHRRLRPITRRYLDEMVPKYFALNAGEHNKILADLTDDLLPLAGESPTERTKASDALDSLVKYIPTESITLYVAASSAMPMILKTFVSVTEASVYWFFGLLTPILFLLIFAGKRRTAGLSALPKLREWPWWRLIASTVAFLVWALAIPTTPYLTGEAGKVVAAFFALFISIFLGLLEPIFER
jgi:hypothetical protein